MQGCDDRHLKAAQEFQDVRARWSAENSIFVLHANQINVAEIEEIRGLAVRSQLILGKLEANPGGVAVAFFRIVDRAMPAAPWPRIPHEWRHTNPS